MSFGLPSTGSVVLYSISEPRLAGGAALLNELESYFRVKGYRTVKKQPAATVEDLRAIPSSCSVFFFNTHTLYDHDREGKLRFLAFESNTPDTPENRVRYAAELDADLLAINCGILKDEMGRPVKDENGHFIERCDENDRLWITPRFMRKYWRFDPNSMVFIHSCHSFHDTVLDIVLGRITDDERTSGCGAGMLAGWTMGGIGDLNVRFLFDRLLGANLLGTITPGDKNYLEDPPQRPFNISAVLDDMGRRKLQKSKDYDSQCDSELIVAHRPGCDLCLLAPSIKCVEIDEKEKRVRVDGFFGSGTPKIRVFVMDTKDRNADLKSGIELVAGTPENGLSITCSGLPDRGPGSEGYIVAAADYEDGCLVRSNAVPITAWHGTFTYTVRACGQEIGRITADIFLRGDIHRPREEPGMMPVSWYCTFSNVLDNERPANFCGLGTYTNPASGDRFQWSGEGTIMPGACGPDGRFDVRGTFRNQEDLLHPRLHVSLVTGDKQVLLNAWGKDNDRFKKDFSTPISLVFLASEMTTPLAFGEFLGGKITWEEKEGRHAERYDIPCPGDLKRDFAYQGVTKKKDFTADLTWDTLEALFPPDKDTVV